MPTGETASALLAGWVSGAATALAVTALVLFAVSRDPAWRERLGRTRLRLPLLGVVVVNAMMLFWTLVGLVLGAIYLFADQPAFSITVVAVIGLGLLLFSSIRGMPGWVTWATVAISVLTFAGMLPALASSG